MSVAAGCCQKKLVYITTPYSYLETVAFDQGNFPQVILMHFCHMFISFPALNGQDQQSTTKTRFLLHCMQHQIKTLKVYREIVANLPQFTSNFTPDYLLRQNSFFSFYNS